MRRLQNALSYGNVTATIAVVLAMSGTAVAVTAVPKDSVVSASIRDGQVRPPDIGATAVTGAKIRSNAVRSAKIKDATVRTPDLAPGSVASDRIADGQVQTADLGDAAVSTAKVADKAITSGKLADDAVGSREIANRSITGEEIATGQIVHAYVQTVTVPPTSSRKVLVTCGFAGEVPVSGGGYWEGSNDSFVNLWMMESHIALSSNGWYTRVSNPGQASRNWNATVTCLG
jgi:hypothetical protein